MTVNRGELRDCLERIYSRYNRREFISPDPLEFLWRYDETADREIAGLVASGLAYGRVRLIVRSVERVLGVLGPSPSSYLMTARPGELSDALKGFRHRFTAPGEVVALLRAASSVQKEHGLIGELLVSLTAELSFDDALEYLVGVLLERAGMNRCSLLPRPGLGSACKRLHLFLRWMVRRDDVDPGGWDRIPRSVLTVPLDVHMFRVGKRLGFTGRRTPGCAAAREITGAFRELNPEDPVKYDFALTRMGIQRRDTDQLFVELFDECGCLVDDGAR